MPNPTRIVVPIDSQDPSAWAHALAYAYAIGARGQPEVRDYILLTHGKQQLKSTSLAGHVGAQEAKTLLGNAVVPLPTGGQLRHATLQTLRGSGRGAVIIAYYADEGILEMLDGVAGIIGIVAVPDLPGEIDGWITRWNPLVHGQQQASAPSPLITDPVVEKALTALSGWINLSHALMNPRDKSHADETLRILRAKGHALEPDKIKSWAIRNGWKPGAADELAKLAGRIGGMKTKPSLKDFHNPDGKYESWSK
ncbi:hypothetical protein ACYQR9_15530 [Methylobacterium sp. CM6241]